MCIFVWWIEMMVVKICPIFYEIGFITAFFNLTKIIVGDFVKKNEICYSDALKISKKCKR